MVDNGIVTGSIEQAQELIIGKTKVYVHSDIQRCEEIVEASSFEVMGDSSGGKVTEPEVLVYYQYHEIVYDKDEYIKLMAEQNKELNSIMNTMLGVSE